MTYGPSFLLSLCVAGSVIGWMLSFRSARRVTVGVPAVQRKKYYALTAPALSQAVYGFCLYIFMNSALEMGSLKPEKAESISLALGITFLLVGLVKGGLSKRMMRGIQKDPESLGKWFLPLGLLDSLCLAAMIVGILGMEG